MLNLTVTCQVKYGSFISMDSEPLPADLRFVSRDQLPLKTPSRIFSSLQERWNIEINNYKFLRKSLLKLHKMTQTLFQNDNIEDWSEDINFNDEVLEEFEGGDISFIHF